MTTHSSILAQRIPTDRGAWLQSMGLQRVRHNWATKHSTTHAYTQHRYNTYFKNPQNRLAIRPYHIPVFHSIPFYSIILAIVIKLSGHDTLNLGSPNPRPWNATSQRPVRNWATQQEGGRQVSKPHLCLQLLLIAHLTAWGPSPVRSAQN